MRSKSKINYPFRIYMPVTTRPRRLRKGFWAGSTSTRTRKTQQRRKTNYKKVGLNKVEKKEVKKIIGARKELKYCPAWFSYDDYAATGGFIQRRIPSSAVLDGIYDSANNACVCVGLQTGNYLNSASQAINTQYPFLMYPMGGFGMERGDTNTTIDGDYAYLNSSMIDIQVALSVNENQNSVNPISTPLEFRLIHVKAKKDQAGVTPSPLTELFVDLTNEKEGLDMSGSVNEIMRRFPINSNRFIKVKDFKFKLQNPIKPTTLQTIPAGGTSAQLSDSTASQPPAHPSTKDIKLWLDKPKKKLRFANTDNGLNNYFEPVNYDFVHYVFLIATRDTYYNSYSGATGGASQDASGWTVSATGRTTYRDC